MRWFLLLSLVVQLVSSKIFEKCELADVLENKHKMPRDDVKNWVCIAEHESTFNTEAVNRFKNWDGSKDYGLFQLNNKFWCKDDDENPAFQNVCNMPCSKLLDEDLTDDMVCIKKIIRGTEAWKGKGTGLTAWVAYVTKCQNRNLDEYMSECWAEDNVIGFIKNEPGDKEEEQDDNVSNVIDEEEQDANAINVRDEEDQEVNPINVRVNIPVIGSVGSAIVDNPRVPIRPNFANFRVGGILETEPVELAIVDNPRVPIRPNFAKIRAGIPAIGSLEPNIAKFRDGILGIGSVGSAIVDNPRVPIGPMTPYFHFFQPQQPIFIPQQPFAASPSAQHIIYQPQLQFQQV